MYTDRSLTDLYSFIARFRVSHSFAVGYICIRFEEYDLFFLLTPIHN